MKSTSFNSVKNIFLAAALILASSLASAHPGSSDDLTSIGVGTKFKMLKPINLPANKIGVEIGRRDTATSMEWCDLYAEGAKDYDREIAVGTVLTVIQVKLNLVPISNSEDSGRDYTIRFSEIPEISFTCEKLNVSFRDMLINIGDFQAMTANSFSIKLPPPHSF